MRVLCAIGIAATMLGGSVVCPKAADYLEAEFPKSRAYSAGVMTEGGRILWMAGQTALKDENGKDISGQFDAQVRTIFREMDKTLKKAGGSLADVVTITVFINDPRNGDRMATLRREAFAEGKWPGSTMITVSNFAQPGMLVEIEGVAVIGDRCSDSNRCLPR
jgi:2-iminobutanoate/2-iminopropanoate deaminase